ncbi:hypothetical protein NMY3_01178 [Candidatus Nitrosocosmicus oleophilus]|uniref:Uncharacterized protein n=1 Tax=Candidatus Nitrosocosmicus oleophilus TaxID=1353260 RepID=A0A654LYG3_9ARCH|nr:hypothetical protein NMY3_01178 [Candidatus Nitrosocosmicus oleophilus]
MISSSIVVVGGCFLSKPKINYFTLSSLKIFHYNKRREKIRNELTTFVTG